MTDLLDRLPTRHEVGADIVETARRARRLRSLYRLICRIETEQAQADCDTATADNGEVADE